jgi:hypothetical protein
MHVKAGLGGLVLLAISSVPGRPQQSSHSTLMLRVEPECSIASSVATPSGGQAGALEGVTAFRYKLRTSGAGGAAILLQLGAPGAKFNYLVQLPAAGTQFSGSSTIADASPITIATFGPNAHSSRAGDPGSITWSLEAAAGTQAPPMTLKMRCN